MGTLLLDMPLQKKDKPIQINKDKSISTEISITVTDPKINKGRPTNIPSIWEGMQLPQDQAIKKALKSKAKFKSYNNVKEAVEAAKKRSKSLNILDVLEYKPDDPRGIKSYSLTLRDKIRKN